jgi:hypothetical protein
MTQRDKVPLLDEPMRLVESDHPLTGLSLYQPSQPSFSATC